MISRISLARAIDARTCGACRLSRSRRHFKRSLSTIPPKRRFVAVVHREGRRLLPEIWPGCDAGVRRRKYRGRDDHQRRGGDDELLHGAGAAGQLASPMRTGLDGQLPQQGRVCLDGGEKHHVNQGLKGKRIAVARSVMRSTTTRSRFYRSPALRPREVTWVPVGNDATARAAALQSNRADAALLTAPSYFRMEEAGLQEPRRTWPITRTSMRPRCICSLEETVAAKPEAAGVDPSRSSRSDQALLRRSRVRRKGITSPTTSRPIPKT